MWTLYYICSFHTTLEKLQLSFYIILSYWLNLSDRSSPSSQELFEAEQDLKKALYIEPNNADVKALLRKLKVGCIWVRL